MSEKKLFFDLLAKRRKLRIALMTEFGDFSNRITFLLGHLGSCC